VKTPEVVAFFGAPDPDAATMRRAIDRAPIEELLDALVRRSERAMSLARAAFHQAEYELEPARLADLVRRCEASASKCRAYSTALRALAPGSEQDQRAFNLALEAASLAVVIAPGARKAEGHA
jgi:Tfp pilus assembly protein PilX